MTVSDALSALSIPRSDAEILLAHVLRSTRTAVFAHPERELTAKEEELFKDAVTRRGRGEPVSYITGTKEFYGRMFQVNRHVLIPRPASEILVSVALDLIDGGGDRAVEADSGIVVVGRNWKRVVPPLVVDVGTGSGCIATTLALERPKLNVIAIDVSPDALAVAEQNILDHKVQNRVTCKLGSLLEPVKDLAKPFLLVSNPPYIPEGEVLMKDVADFEPHTALFAGNDGTDIIKQLLHEAKEHPFCIGAVMEMRADQASGLSPHFSLSRSVA